ncbi:unnamed protein product, partial [Meganyctiphanes norvegica]
MFDNSYYHTLDSFVPPSANDNISIQSSRLRLENICAIAIVRNERNCQTLSETPTHLHQILWKAYLRDEYDMHEDSGCKLGKIPELLYNWPHKEFILKEVMPTIPPRLNRFASFWDVSESICPFRKTSHIIKLKEFHEKVVNMIAASTFMIDHENLASPINIFEVPIYKHDFKIRKIDISGFHIFNLENITGMEKMNEPIFKNCVDKLEVTLDVSLYRQKPCLDGIEVALNQLNELAQSYSNSSNSVAFKFGHVSLYTDWLNSQTQDVTHLLEILVSNGTVSIYLGGNIEGSDIIEEVFKNNASQANILAVELVTSAYSLNFVQYLKNLVHLSLSNNNLHDKLDSLSYMHRGLIYLDMNNCNLNNRDLAPLVGSCHQLTLRELRLEENSFNYK